MMTSGFFDPRLFATILGFAQKMALISKLVDIRLSKGEEVVEEYGNDNNSFF